MSEDEKRIQSLEFALQVEQARVISREARITELEITIEKMRNTSDLYYELYEFINKTGADLGIPVDEMASKDIVRTFGKLIRRFGRALQDIANANGEESFVLSSQRQIMGYQQGTQAQAERAKKALGLAYKEQMPANMVLDAVARYREALEAILQIHGMDALEGGDFAHGYNDALGRVVGYALKALGR